MTAPLPPPADDKDWTWVLDAPCAECGYDASDVSDVPMRIRSAVALLQAALREPGAAERPQPQVWSPLEYGAHVRDVCIVFGTRLAAMRGSDDPLFPNWDQDDTALADRYWEQDPAVVADQLGIEGERIADGFASLAAQEWQRPGRRSNGSTFTIDSLARYLLHDLEHHVHDVRRA